ncbi:MAG: DUF4149 domain-containing protein [Tepidisphaeraceae bacterium]
MRTLSAILGVCLGLWLGILAHQMMSAMIVFRSGIMPREQAALTAATLFNATEKVVLGLGGVTLLLSLLSAAFERRGARWRWPSACCSP